MRSAELGVLVVLALMLSTSAARAQEVLHPERIAVLLARERLVRDGQTVRDLAAIVARTTTPPGTRVHAARVLAEVQGRLESDLRLARSVQVTVEPVGEAEWLRLVGTPLAQLDAEARTRDCAALAVALHVMSDDARWCAQPPTGQTERELPEPLYVPGYVAAFAEDHEGTTSPVAYADAERAVALAPRDEAARLRLASMQLAMHDVRAAEATLRGLAATYVVSLSRALLAYASGRPAEAQAALEALVRADPSRPEAAFDLAQLTLGFEPNEWNRPTRAVAVRALALFRLASCNAARGLPGSAELGPATVAWSDRLQFWFERPRSWSGWGAYRAPVEGLARPPQSAPSRGPPMVSCAQARARALEVLDAPTGSAPRASPGPLRALRPPTSSLVGPRPTFVWSGAPSVVIELCAERACATVEQTLRPGASPFVPGADLPVGRHFWRVKSGATASAVRVLWVAPRARGALRFPDVDCDGLPDVPLGPTGWYARFAADGTPTLAVLPGDETATAETVFAGDVDGDGCGDFAQATGFGVQVLYGAPGGPSWPVLLPGVDAESVALLGDVDGDGRDDLLLGANGPGQVWTASSGAQPWPFYARDALPVGDVNGDGLDDAAASEFDSMAQRGTWSLVAGTGRGLAAATRTPIPVTRGLELLRAAGDVTGDGLDDVLLFHPDRDERDPPGRMALHRGTRQGFEARPLGRAVPADSPYVSVHPLGDVDGDGRGDAIWRDRDTITLQLGGARGLGAGTALGAWPHDAELFAQRFPGAARVWLFEPFSTRAVRVDAGRVTEVVLAPP